MLKIKVKFSVAYLLTFFFLCNTSVLAAQFVSLTDFGDNPGRLDASLLVAEKSTDKLLVFLHGCTQLGEQFVKESQLQALAERQHFLLLVPQQSRMNNINRCFNWFSESDASKRQGESLSLINMIQTVKQRFNVKEVGIVGISAGAAMITPLIIQAPDLFQYAIIVAATAYQCADGLMSGLSCMYSGPQDQSAILNNIKQQWPSNSAIPMISIWQGGADKLVNPVNATMLAAQWQQAASQPLSTKQLPHESYQQTQWHDSQGNLTITLFTIYAMGHAMPITTEQAPLPKFIYNSELSIARYIAEVWRW